MKNFKENTKELKLLNKRMLVLPMPRNKGIKSANGEYLCFVDSDDWVEKKIIVQNYIVC